MTKLWARRAEQIRCVVESTAGMYGDLQGIAGKTLHKCHVPGPTGVRGRNSDNTLIGERLGWRPTQPLKTGLEKNYAWIEQQVRQHSP